MDLKYVSSETKRQNLINEIHLKFIYFLNVVNPKGVLIWVFTNGKIMTIYLYCFISLIVTIMLMYGVKNFQMNRRGVDEGQRIWTFHNQK